MFTTYGKKGFPGKQCPAQSDIASAFNLYFLSGEGRTQKRPGRRGMIFFCSVCGGFCIAFFKRTVVHHKRELFKKAITKDLSHFIKTQYV